MNDLWVVGRMIRAAVLALLPVAAVAEDRFTFGPGNHATMQATPDGAEIIIRNDMIAVGSPHVGAVEAGGLSVIIEAQHMPGSMPDTFTFYPPDGYVAVPGRVTLAEGASAVVLILPGVGS